MRHHTVVPGDTLYAIARQYDTTVAAIALANSWIDDINLVKPGWVFHIPEPVPPAEPEPEPPADSSFRDWLTIRTDARWASLVNAHFDAFAYPIRRHTFIGGAFAPGSGKASPKATTDWLRPGSPNYSLGRWVERAEQAGLTGSELVVDYAVPLGFRGTVASPKTPARAAAVREQLASIPNDASYLNHMRDVAAAIREAHDRTGVRFSMRQGWECAGFDVWAWSPGGPSGAPVLDSDLVYAADGTHVTADLSARWHTHGALDEFVAAWKAQSDVFAEYGLPVFLCFDKRSFDVMADGPYEGQLITDVLFDQLGAHVAQSGGETPIGPAYWGGDMYTPARVGDTEFDVRYRPVLDRWATQAQALGLRFASGEWGIGDGIPTGEGGTDEFVDEPRPFDLMFAWLDSQPAGTVGLVNLYVPNNSHRLPRGSKLRDWLFDYLGVPDNVNMPIYEHELT